MNKRMRKKQPRRELLQQLKHELREFRRHGTQGMQLLKGSKRDAIALMEAGWLHIGYEGMHRRTDCHGAIPGGTAVVKVGTEPGDANPDGTRGVIAGSIGTPDGELLYFVLWDHEPRRVRGVGASRIRPEGA